MFTRESGKVPATHTVARPTLEFRRSSSDSTLSNSLATVAVAAERYAVSTKTIRRRIADGSITGYRFGPRAIRVDLREVDRLLKPLPTANVGGAK